MNNRHIIANYINEYAEQLSGEAKKEKIQDATLSNLINSLVGELSVIAFAISFNSNHDDLKNRMIVAIEYAELLILYDGYQAKGEKVKKIFAIYQNEVDSIPDANQRHQENMIKLAAFREHVRKFNEFHQMKK